MGRVISTGSAKADDPIYKESWTVFSHRRSRSSTDTTPKSADGETKERKTECLATDEVTAAAQKKTVKKPKEEVDSYLALLSAFLQNSTSIQMSLFENEQDDWSNEKIKYCRRAILLDDKQDVDQNMYDNISRQTDLFDDVSDA